MSRYIGIDPACMDVRSYGANSRGKVAVVKLELEVRDHEQLGWLLREIASAQAECLAARAVEQASAPPAVRKGGPKKGRKPAARQIGHQPLLAIPYFGSDDQ